MWRTMLIVAVLVGCQSPVTTLKDVATPKKVANAESQRDRFDALHLLNAERCLKLGGVPRLGWSSKGPLIYRGCDFPCVHHSDP